jgi:hypothetical protein
VVRRPSGLPASLAIIVKAAQEYSAGHFPVDYAPTDLATPAVARPHDDDGVQDALPSLRFNVVVDGPLGGPETEAAIGSFQSSLA